VEVGMSQLVNDLRVLLSDEMERRADELVSLLAETLSSNGNGTENEHVSAVQDRIRIVGALIASLNGTDPASVARGRVGLGSVVRVRDLDSYETQTFTIVPIDLVDGTENRVTLASPVGQAIMGARPGDTVDISTPSHSRSVSIEHVTTIWDSLNEWSREFREADAA
jgi:transcription elongation factor GreA